MITVSGGLVLFKNILKTTLYKILVQCEGDHCQESRDSGEWMMFLEYFAMHEHFARSVSEESWLLICTCRRVLLIRTISDMLLTVSVKCWWRWVKPLNNPCFLLLDSWHCKDTSTVECEVAFNLLVVINDQMLSLGGWNQWLSLSSSVSSSTSLIEPFSAVLLSWTLPGRSREELTLAGFWCPGLGKASEEKSIWRK